MWWFDSTYLKNYSQIENKECLKPPPRQDCMRDLSGIGEFWIDTCNPSPNTKLIKPRDASSWQWPAPTVMSCCSSWTKSKQVKFSCKKFCPRHSNWKPRICDCCPRCRFRPAVVPKWHAPQESQVSWAKGWRNYWPSAATTDSQASSQSSSVLNGWTTSHPKSW